ncbi:MAG: hypothetical protein OHK0017_07690 [Patescibacteria group bacterium]
MPRERIKTLQNLPAIQEENISQIRLDKKRLIQHLDEYHLLILHLERWEDEMISPVEPGKKSLGRLLIETIFDLSYLQKQTNQELFKKCINFIVRKVNSLIVQYEYNTKQIDKIKTVYQFRAVFQLLILVEIFNVSEEVLPQLALQKTWSRKFQSNFTKYLNEHSFEDSIEIIQDFEFYNTVFSRTPETLFRCDSEHYKLILLKLEDIQRNGGLPKFIASVRSHLQCCGYN